MYNYTYHNLYVYQITHQITLTIVYVYQITCRSAQLHLSKITEAAKTVKWSYENETHEHVLLL